MSGAMNTLRQYMTPDEMHIVLRGCTKREVNSLVWCVEHMPEPERRPYLQRFIDISRRSGTWLAQPASAPVAREMVRA